MMLLPIHPNRFMYDVDTANRYEMGAANSFSVANGVLCVTLGD
jgi:hypothetical protein